MSQKYKVLIADKISELAGEVFARYPELEVDVKTGMPPEELLTVADQYHGIIVRSATRITKEVIDVASQLKVVGRAGIGVDNIDVAECSRRGIVVMNTPDSSAITTAEHTISLMMSVVRNIPQGTMTLKQGQWKKSALSGRELNGKTLGIIGLGNIGRRVVERCQGLGMKVMGYDPFTSEERARQLGVELVDLDKLFTHGDIFTCHTPLTDQTRGLINKDRFAQMKDGVYVINCARGGIVHEGDLEEALKSGKVAGAAFDVFEQEPPATDHPLLAQDNFICTPHLGASTSEAQSSIARSIAEQMADYLVKDEVRNALNYPSVPAEQKEILLPYINLAETIGRFAGQAFTGKVQRLEIFYEGVVGTYPIRHFTSALQKGILERSHSSILNYINAPVLMKEHGIKTEETLREGKNFTSAIALELHGEDHSILVRGVLYSSDDPRIVQVDHYSLEVVPEGALIMMRNRDEPGVIGGVGTLLGQHGVNISRLQLGLNKENKTALSFWGIQEATSQTILDELSGLENVESVVQLVM